MGRPATHPHIVGLGEVAARCGVSRSTVNRHRATLEENGAWKDDAGVWHVPVSALLALGWNPHPDTSPGASPSVAPVRRAAPAERAELESRVSVLEAELAAARAEAGRWRSFALELCMTLEDTRRSMLRTRGGTNRRRGDDVGLEPSRFVTSSRRSRRR